VNQRHAVIVRREEKLTVRRWCSIAVRTTAFLKTPEAAAEVAVSRLPAEEKLENDEPRTRPLYWARLLEPPLGGAEVAPECSSLR